MLDIDQNLLAPFAVDLLGPDLGTRLMEWDLQAAEAFFLIEAGEDIVSVEKLAQYMNSVGHHDALRFLPKRKGSEKE